MDVSTGLLAGRIDVDMFQCFVRLEDDEGGLLDTVDDIDGVPGTGRAVHGFEDNVSSGFVVAGLNDDFVLLENDDDARVAVGTWGTGGTTTCG